MSLRTIASFTVAIVLGLLAVILVRGFLLPKTTSPQAAGPTSPVVVAVVQINRGMRLQPAMLKVANYPTDAVPAGAFASIQDAVGKDGAKTAVRAIAPNEPLLASKLSGANKNTLSAELQPGMRAVSVRSSDVAGVGGFVLPGDRVDIMITRNVGQGNEQAAVTEVLAQNARVLGVDQTSDQEADKPVVAKAVTVEVTPEQAQKLSLGQNIGQVTLSLRSVEDGAPLQSSVTTVSDLASGHHAAVKAKHASVAKPAPANAPDVVQVRVTRGVEIADYPIGTR